MASNVPDHLKLAVLSAALKGVPGIQICRENSIDGDLLRSILVDHGWPNRKAVKWRLEVLQEDLDASAPKTHDGAEPQLPPAVASPLPLGDPSSPVVSPSPGELCSHVSLLEAASHSRHSATRSRAEKVQLLLEDLTARIREEVADPVTKPNATPAEMREWALRTGVKCPQFGRLPHWVRHAYAAAHAKAVQAS